MRKRTIILSEKELDTIFRIGMDHNRSGPRMAALHHILFRDDIMINESGAELFCLSSGSSTFNSPQWPRISHSGKGRGMLIKLFSSFLLLFFSTSHNTQKTKSGGLDK